MKAFGYLLSPKEADENVDEFQILVEPQDAKVIRPQDAAHDQDIWAALMWGNKRDWAFIRQLRRLESLHKLRAKNVAHIREGIIPTAQGKLHPGTVGRRFWDGEEFPPNTSLYLSEDRVARSDGVRTHRATSLAAFKTPQLVIKQGWQEAVRRFQAVLTESSTDDGILFTQSYVSVHVSDAMADILKAACLSYNSIFAVYFLLLTSSRFASYRPEPLVDELLRVPIPDPKPDILSGVRKRDSVCDARVCDAFGFKEAEWVLVEDLFDVTLADFKGDANSRGRRRTQRNDGLVEEPDLRQYCEHFIRVLKATFGQDKNVSATVFREKASPWLPFRLVAFQLNCPASSSFRSEPLESPALLEELEQLNQRWLQTRAVKTGTIYHQRVARIYDYRDSSPRIYIIKPDACRYWTRSMGLHDADEVAADFMRWQMASVEATRR